MAAKKIMLVTGANQGIGFEASYALAAASPTHHIIMGSRNAERGAKALKELQDRKPAGSLSTVELDITNDKTIEATVQKITADFGVLDVLVNNAGIVMTDAKDRRGELLETINVNSVSPVVLTEALVPLLKKSKDPRIINVSSGLGSITNREDPNYGAYQLPAEAYRMSKAALNMASVCMNVMYKDWGAKVWPFCPGLVVTNLTGEGDRQKRVDMGADKPETPAKGILEIATGERDSDVGKFVRKDGQRFGW